MNVEHRSVIDEEFIPEHFLNQVVEKAKRLYTDRESRLQYCAMVLGKNNITNPNCFYHYYFEVNENVPQ